MPKISTNGAWLAVDPQNGGKKSACRHKWPTGSACFGVKYFLLIQDPAVCGEGHHLPGDELAAVLQRRFGSMLQSAAAGHLHTHHGHAADVVFPEDLRQFFRVVHAIQLGAAYQRDMAFHKALVEGGIGVGGAVGGDQQLRAGEVWGVGRDQFDLHRPLSQAIDWPDGGRLPGIRLRRLDTPEPTARTTAGQGCAFPAHLLLLIGQDRLFVIGGSLPLHKGDGAGGTGGEAVAQPVAVVVPHEFRLAVHHGNGPLVAGGGASAAAVAFAFIYGNDPSFHNRTSLFF